MLKHLPNKYFDRDRTMCKLIGHRIPDGEVNKGKFICRGCGFKKADFLDYVKDEFKKAGKNIYKIEE